MITSTATQNTATAITNNQQTIIDDIFKSKSVPLKKHFVSRFTYIQSDIEEAGLQPTESRLLASINSLFFGRDVAKTNRSQLARKTTFTKETISRSMQRLQHRHHLIEYDNTGRGYIIRLSGFARSISKLVKHYGQLGLKKLFQLYCRLKDIFEGNDTEQILAAEISANEPFTDPDPKTDPDPDQNQVSATSEVRSDHFRSDPGALLTYLYKESFKETETAPAACLPDPKTPVQPETSNQPQAVHSENQKTETETINRACKKILSLPRKPGKPFNPFQAVQWAVKNGFHHRAITETICAMASKNVWQDIGNPFGWFKSVVSTRSKNCNEQDFISRSDNIKADEKIHGAKFDGFFQKALSEYREKKKARKRAFEIDLNMKGI